MYRGCSYDAPSDSTGSKLCLHSRSAETVTRLRTAAPPSPHATLFLSPSFFFHALLYSIHPLVSIPRLFFKEIKQATIDRFISREGEKTLDFLQDGNSLSSPLLSCQVFGRKMGRGRIGPNRSYQVQVSRSKGGGNSTS